MIKILQCYAHEFFHGFLTRYMWPNFEHPFWSSILLFETPFFATQCWFISPLKSAHLEEIQKPLSFGRFSIESLSNMYPKWPCSALQCLHPPQGRILVKSFLFSMAPEGIVSAVAISPPETMRLWSTEISPPTSAIAIVCDISKSSKNSAYTTSGDKCTQQGGRDLFLDFEDAIASTKSKTHHK